MFNFYGDLLFSASRRSQRWLSNEEIEPSAFLRSKTSPRDDLLVIKSRWQTERKIESRRRKEDVN